MSEMAAELVAQMWDDMGTDREREDGDDYAPRSKYFSCNRCGAKVKWKQDKTTHKWLIINSNGMLHFSVCKARVSAAEEFDVLR